MEEVTEVVAVVVADSGSPDQKRLERKPWEALPSWYSTL